MTVEDDDGTLVIDQAVITHIEWDESNSGNEYLAVYAQPPYNAEDDDPDKYWVWNRGWQNELTNRENFYIGKPWKICHVKKFPAYWVFKYLQPVKDKHMDEWVNLPSKEEIWAAYDQQENQEQNAVPTEYV